MREVGTERDERLGLFFLPGVGMGVPSPLAPWQIITSLLDWGVKTESRPPVLLALWH